MQPHDAAQFVELLIQLFWPHTEVNALSMYDSLRTLQSCLHNKFTNLHALKLNAAVTTTHRSS